MGKVVVTITSSGLDKVRIQEVVLGEAKREIEINLARILPENLNSAIGSVVLGRIAMQEFGSISGDFGETAHRFAEAMAQTNHPELLFTAYTSANARASQMRDAAVLDIAETFLKASADLNYGPAVAALADWPLHKTAITKYWNSLPRPDES